MNHTVRAKGIVGRAMPPKVLVRSETGRKYWIDISSWHADMVKAVARGLRTCERDSYNKGVRQATNAAGDHMDRLNLNPNDRREVVRRMLSLERKGRAARRIA